MAVALAIQHWRPYLLGRKFTVYSNQKSLKQLLQQRITTGSQQNWLAKLLGYNFEIAYKPGLENMGADALLRSMGEMELNSLAYIPVLVKVAMNLQGLLLSISGVDKHHSFA